MSQNSLPAKDGHRAVSWPGIEPATESHNVQRPNHYTTDRHVTFNSNDNSMNTVVYNKTDLESDDQEKDLVIQYHYSRVSTQDHVVFTGCNSPM